MSIVIYVHKTVDICNIMKIWTKPGISYQLLKKENIVNATDRHTCSHHTHTHTHTDKPADKS
jgi:hypothetical protein